MIDIERWIPECWDHIVANDQLKEYFFDLIWCVRKEGHQSGFNLLTTGPSRSGKTATITFGIKCLGCLDFDFVTMTPCGRCRSCTDKVHLYGNDGWQNYIDFMPDGGARTPIRYHFLPVDCTRLTESELDRQFDRIRYDDSTIRVIYLDEVHRLSRRFLDERLLKPLEDFPAIWIASSTYVKQETEEDSTKLDKMFQNRFTYRITTQRPSMPTLAVWLAERCSDWGIKCEDPEHLLMLLAERCHQIPGLALQVLNRAHKKRSKLITRDMVDGHVFDFDD
jgi:hypothetical protein